MGSSWRVMRGREGGSLSRVWSGESFDERLVGGMLLWLLLRRHFSPLCPPSSNHHPSHRISDEADAKMEWEEEGETQCAHCKAIVSENE